MNLTKAESLGTKPRGDKQIQYWRDEHGTIFSDPLDQSDMVGGGAEEERNELENPERLVRILQMCPGDPFVMDFGCGHGKFIEYLTDQGIRAWGYDKFNPPYATLPAPESVDIVTMVEVVEHLSTPFSEFQDIFNALKPGGKFYIETSFTDWHDFDSWYIDPVFGHSTVYSHAGLTYILSNFGFVEGQHFNRNARVYIKP